MVRFAELSANCFEGTEAMPMSFRECRNDEFMLLPVDMHNGFPRNNWNT